MTDIGSVQQSNMVYPRVPDRNAARKPAVINNSEIPDTFERKPKKSVAGDAAAIGTTSALIFSTLKMPYTVNKVIGDFKGKSVPKNVKIAGIATGGVIATAAYALAGTGIGAACGSIIDNVNNKSHKQNPVADNNGLSAEVSEQPSERPALIDGDFEPENNDETNESNSDITAEGA